MWTITVAQLLADHVHFGDRTGGSEALVHIDLLTCAFDIFRWKVRADSQVEDRRRYLLRLRLAAALCDRFLKDLAIGLKAHRGDESRLSLSEQIAGASDLQVAH